MAIVADLAFNSITGRFKGIALPSIEAIGSVVDVFETSTTGLNPRHRRTEV
jgi:hypothetical protein